MIDKRKKRGQEWQPSQILATFSIYYTQIMSIAIKSSLRNKLPLISEIRISFKFYSLRKLIAAIKPEIGFKSKPMLMHDIVIEPMISIFKCNDRGRIKARCVKMISKMIRKFEKHNLLFNCEY